MERFASATEICRSAGRTAHPSRRRKACSKLVYLRLGLTWPHPRDGLIEGRVGVLTTVEGKEFLPGKLELADDYAALLTGSG